MGFGLWRVGVAVLCHILCFHGLCYSEQAPNYTFVKHATQAPPISYYDYIIIGGGTAGCPLAATLSQHFKVLLIERGGSPYGNKNISNLASFVDTLCDLSPTSASQQFISEDGVISARARVLGGGSSINTGFYARARPEEVHDAGWNGELVKKSYEWVERVVSFEPRVLQWQSAMRDGLLEAGVTPYNGFTYDHMYGTKVGGTIFDRDGHRHTAADLLEYANRDGLTVLLHATVHKILFTHKGTPMPVAHGVDFMDSSGRKHRAYLKKGAKNEIIVSAGAIGSPQLLMLSGIGPRNHLKSLGIKVVVDQPMVGQGMSDNPMNGIYIPSPSPVEVSVVQIVGITRFGSYIESLGGTQFPLCSFSEVPQRSNLGMVLPQVKIDEGTPSAVIEAINNIKDAPFRAGFIVEKIMNPLSRGHLHLLNTNPNDNPSVSFNYFKEPEDLQTCVKGLKMIESVIQSKAFSEFRYPNISTQALRKMTANLTPNLPPKHDNDSTSLEQYCKDTVMTIYHFHGGCQVDQVVDHDYRVQGVDALRVIDGSTFTSSPGTNPQATLMMLGRYMGVMIQNQRLERNGAY